MTECVRWIAKAKLAPRVLGKLSWPSAEKMKTALVHGCQVKSHLSNNSSPMWLDQTGRLITIFNNRTLLPER